LFLRKKSWLKKNTLIRCYQLCVSKITCFEVVQWKMDK
jgi:hypothetical protein